MDHSILPHYENLNHGTLDYNINKYEIKFDNGLSLYPHFHNEYEIFIIKKGDGIVNIEGRDYYLKAGEGVFIHSSFVHSARKWKCKNVTFIAIVFGEQLIGNGFDSLIYKKYVEPITKYQFIFPEELSGENMKGILEKAVELAYVYDSRNEGFEIEVINCLQKIWLELFKNKSDSEKRKNRISEIKQAVFYIEEHYSEKISLNQLSGVAMMSREHFDRKFLEVMQMTPFQFINITRLRKSTLLLRTTDLSIADIAQNCGYTDASYFVRAFKKEYGITPSKYRNSKK